METSVDLYAEDYADDYVEISDDNAAEENENQTEVIDIQGIENQESEDKDEEEKKVVKPKRVIRNPRPKLDAEALKSRKGLLCLEGYFKNKQFKGRGHEEEDLQTIMKTYEYWCHRLFPKFSFDDCLAKLETLGAKKNVQVYMKRIRMDMVSDEEEVVRSDHEDEPTTNTNQGQFDDLLLQQDTVNESIGLTEAQLERIRLNREKANRLRQGRLQQDHIFDELQDSNTLVAAVNEESNILHHNPSSEIENEVPDM